MESSSSSPHPPREALRDFSERWGVCELAVFGSAARNELTSESDVDLEIVWTTPTRDVAALVDQLEEIAD